MINQWTGERTIWYNPGDHLKEFKAITNYYMEAMEFAKGKTVADVGCGEAFGTFLLSLVAKKVDGYDIELNHEYASKFPVQCPALLHVLDLEQEVMPVEADLCVAIELIEHLENPEFFLENLKTQAIFFTVPCYGDRNPFHKIEYDEGKAADLIKKYFPNLSYRMENKRMIGLASK